MTGSSRLVVHAALAGNVLVTATKFAAAGLTGSSAMLSEAVHSVVDCGNGLLMLLGLVAALAGIGASHALGWYRADGVASVTIGVILAGTASFLAWECQSLLTGEAASPEVRGGIRSIVTAERGVASLNELLTMHFGPADVLAAISLEFHREHSAVTVETTVSRIERTIKAAHPEVTRVFIEAQREAAHRSSQEALVEE